MASKLITGPKAAEAQRFTWHETAVRPGNPPPQAATVPAGVRSPSTTETPDYARVLMTQQQRIQELERELEIRPREAYQHGYSEGQIAGAQEASSRIDPVAARMAETIRELAVVRRRYFHEAEKDALQLAVAIARKVLHRELTVDPDCLLGVVKAVFDRVDAREMRQVRLHPDDVAILEKHLANASGLLAHVEITPDPSLERGSVIVETSRGVLDGSITTQLKEIERGLTDLVRQS